MSGASSTFSSPVEVIGSKIYLQHEGMTNPGDLEEIFQYIVANGKIRRIYSLSLDCRVEATCRIIHTDLLNVDTVIASVSTGPAEPFKQFFYSLPRDVLAGETITVDFEAADGTPEIDFRLFSELTERDE